MEKDEYGWHGEGKNKFLDGCRIAKVDAIDRLKNESSLDY